MEEGEDLIGHQEAMVIQEEPYSVYFRIRLLAELEAWVYYAIIFFFLGFVIDRIFQFFNIRWNTCKFPFSRT